MTENVNSGQKTVCGATVLLVKYTTLKETLMTLSCFNKLHYKSMVILVQLVLYVSYFDKTHLKVIVLALCYVASMETLWDFLLRVKIMDKMLCLCSNFSLNIKNLFLFMNLAIKLQSKTIENKKFCSKESRTVKERGEPHYQLR